MAYYKDENGNQVDSEKSDLSLAETIQAIARLGGSFETVHIVWTQGGYSETLWNCDIERLTLVWDMLKLLNNCEAVVPYRNDYREVVVFEVDKDCENFATLEETLRVLAGN